jgi:hypothetical protein
MYGVYFACLKTVCNERLLFISIITQVYVINFKKLACSIYDSTNAWRDNVF